MRYSQDHKAQTHQRIIKEASARFRRDGIGATGLQPLMKALGLTHGGFYSHFKSKDELVEKALQAASEQVDVICAELFAQDRPLEAFIDAYLSEWHQTSPDEGCPLPTMSSELGLRGQQSPTTDVVLNARLEQVQGTLEGDNAADDSVVIMSTLVGALLLSRSVENPELAQRILDVTRAYLKQPRD
ncbi:TetR/AcrR family transcriptional regulator [Pseudomonas sp. TH39(2020)]|jgi:TetR/AcrR family transcriptional regulator, transcriptional repressor for nem operon|uniref:TetR/AcrR family transcriptional regulator n=1 Tax=Pseudomonas mandelii TaxID=75612 RepID=A0A502I9B6_9PSED|nr:MULTISPECIES: TetR/AcrR family transcriptional regulator [Pseudomonas]MBK5400164.1 TetR/AcrR family transcriptional regulator [Pseudomonas sp. TH39(2020)]TPG83501.1 TetR/AcrR family transcriptional regulator [Pseudomonas mandelii]